MSPARPPGAPFEPDGRVTGIGSLPMTSFARALETVFRVAPEVPFLPEVPRRSRADGMIARILGDSPGPPSRTRGFPETAARRGSDGLRVPSRATRDFELFIEEIRRRRPAFAKIQFAGPITASFAAHQATDSTEAAPGRLASRVGALVARRAIEAARSIARLGIRPIVFIDEPGLASFAGDPRPLLAPLFARLRRARIVCGVHCCADVDWEILIDCRPDVLSFDAELSLDAVTKRRGSIRRHLERGGTLAPGVVSTRGKRSASSEPSAKEWARRLRAARLPRSRLLLTPACGTGTLTAARDREVWRRLALVATAIRAGVPSR